jgi:hypothetical protein
LFIGIGIGHGTAIPVSFHESEPGVAGSIAGEVVGAVPLAAHDFIVRTFGGTVAAIPVGLCAVESIQPMVRGTNARPLRSPRLRTHMKPAVSPFPDGKL